MIKNVAIAFIVFDGYVDLWDDAIKYMKKFWPDHPPIYVFTNEIIREWDDVTCIPVGVDAEWSRKAQKAIELIKEKYIILLLEDFYVGSAINNLAIEELISFMDANKIKYCKLCDNNRIIHKKKKKYKKSQYSVLYTDEDYGISLQAAVWEREFLKKTIGVGNYNAWIFELNMVKASRGVKHKIMKFAIEDTRNILNIKHGALQGKMLPNTIKYFKKIDDPLATQREVMGKIDYYKYFMKQLGKDIVPRPAVKTVKTIAKKFGYSFVEEKWTS